MFLHPPDNFNIRFAQNRDWGIVGAVIELNEKRLVLIDTIDLLRDNRFSLDDSYSTV